MAKHREIEALQQRLSYVQALRADVETTMHSDMSGVSSYTSVCTVGIWACLAAVMLTTSFKRRPQFYL